jgi:hypothetical protein
VQASPGKVARYMATASHLFVALNYLLGVYLACLQFDRSLASIVFVLWVFGLESLGGGLISRHRRHRRYQKMNASSCSRSSLGALRTRSNRRLFAVVGRSE